MHSAISNSNADSTETVPTWNCSPGCPIAELDNQSTTLGIHAAGNKGLSVCGGDAKNSVYAGGWGNKLENPDYYKDGGSSGGASRFFYQIVPPTKL